MARIRSIKPDIWTDEHFVELSPLARLLFIGLWNFADDDGRMEYSPTRIKLQILPADSCDISELLGEIRGKHRVVVYEVDGKEYLQVVNFTKHQKVDKRTPSKYPEQQAKPAESRRIVPTEGKGMEGKGGEGNGRDSTVANATVAKPEVPPCPHEQIIELYHRILPTAPRVVSWTPTRKGYLQARWRESRNRQLLAWWEQFFKDVAESDFLCGRARPQPGQKPFHADLEWIITQGNFVKILEKKYSNSRGQEGPRKVAL